MKPTTKTVILFLASCTLFSCSQPSPKKVIEVAWLNTNRVTTNYSPKLFAELREAHKGTAVQYVNQYVLDPLKESIAKVERLPENEETRALLAASLDVLTYGKEIFENDYLSIATMIDEGRAESEIDAALEKLFTTHDANLQTRFVKLDELVVPYAEKYNIPIQMANNQLN